MLPSEHLMTENCDTILEEEKVSCQNKSFTVPSGRKKNSDVRINEDSVDEDKAMVLSEQLMRKKYDTLLEEHKFSYPNRRFTKPPWRKKSSTNGSTEENEEKDKAGFSSGQFVWNKCSTSLEEGKSIQPRGRLFMSSNVRKNYSIGSRVVFVEEDEAEQSLRKKCNTIPAEENFSHLNGRCTTIGITTEWKSEFKKINLTFILIIVIR